MCYLYTNSNTAHMKKIYTAITAALLLGTTTMRAQCPGERYHNFVFSSFTLTSNIQYGSNMKTNYAGVGTNQNLMMDIYQPTGDTLAMRPLVIVAHGGSFVGGTKTGTDVAPICKDLAKLGYVAVSIEYRLGMTNFPISSTHTVDSTDAGAAVMRAVHDGRAAVRYFRKNAAVGGNTYRVDTNNIFFAGVSAGGFIALHLAYMDQWSEFPTYVDTTGQPGLHGGIEGNSGNPGYSSDVKAIVNICGALGDVSWMQPGDEPVLSFHGTADNTVPYGSATIYLSGTYPLLVVDGSSTVAARANAIGIENCFMTWPGQDHVPEVGTSANAVAHYDSTLVLTRNFLQHQVCGSTLNCNYTASVYSVVGIEENAAMENLVVYPNPAESDFTIDLAPFQGEELSVALYDVLGKNVKSVSGIKNDKLVLSREGLKNGIYMIRVTANGKTYSRKLTLQ
jgi:para-nitrobenzyl esterase